MKNQQFSMTGFSTRISGRTKIALVLSLVSALVAGVFVQRLAGTPVSEAALVGDETIETVAGAAEGGSAIEMQLSSTDVEVGPDGDLFTASGSRIYRVDSITGVATVYAGIGFSAEDIGDGGSAKEASIGVRSMAFNSAGDLYFSEGAQHRIRKIDFSTGVITTVVGTGTAGYSGDGGLATGAQINNALDLAFDSADNLYLSDSGNHVVRKVDATTGVITTEIGTGSAGHTGDGGPASNAELNGPAALVFDDAGSLYISVFRHLRRVDGDSGIITTVAGNGNTSAGCHEGSALTLPFSAIDLAVDSSGNIYFGNTGIDCVRRLDTSGNLVRVAGTGVPGFSGDGGLATDAQIDGSWGLATDQNDILFISDVGNRRVRKVDIGGTINTVAGIGQVFYSGEGGPANHAVLPGATATAVDSQGNLYIGGSNTIFRVGAADGMLTRLAGNGFPSGSTGDGGPAINATFSILRDLAMGPGGILYIADNDRIRKVDLATGIIDAFAGDGTEGRGGDGGPALDAQFHDPFGIGTDPAGNVYIADTFNNRVRKVDTSGIITTVAGQGSGGLALNYNQPVPALSAHLKRPLDVISDVQGNLYIVWNSGVLLVDTTSTAHVYAGAHGSGSTGDGGPAADAEIGGARSIAIDAEGNLYVAQQSGSPSFPDTDNRIRKINPVTEIITTVVGTGPEGFSGDGGPANIAKTLARGPSFGPDGSLYFGAGAGRVRRVSANQSPVANAGEDQEIFVGNEAQLDGTGSSDPDGDPLTYQWTITAQPAASAAQLSGPTSSRPTITPDVSGEYVIELVVHDGTAASDPDTVIVTAVTPEEELGDLIDDVEDLVPGGQGNGLVALLESAIDKIDQDNINAAVNQLEAFIRQVEKLVDRGELTEAEGQALIDAAQAVIDELTEA